ncbi:MAG: DUF368 domain-containing protein [Oscillospiraceae bacterium]|jgi:putative membrane protein|nr:DUF368 domain-containing protein [Oscillospiraceae bacterium]
MKQFFYRIFCGFFLCFAVLAPGVSGSVMAVMMGIYEDLLAIVVNPFKNFKKNLSWLIPLGIGSAVSALLFFIVFNQLFNTYPLATILLFLGLVAGNLPAVFNDAKSNGFKGKYFIPMVLAFLLALGLGVLQISPAAPDALWYLAICGVIAGVASMVPGISISMTLMLFGVYDRLMAAAKGSIDEALVFVGLRTGEGGFSFIIAAGVTTLCFLAGMFTFSRLTKSVLERHRATAYWTIFAFMCGSLGAIVLKLPLDDPNFSFWQMFLSLPLGIGISLAFVLLGKRMHRGA